MLITVAASAYNRINRSYNDVFNSAAAVRYVTNKLRSCESAELLSDKQLLVKNNDFFTLIYEKDGILYERFFPEGAQIKAESGEMLFSVRDFSISCEDGKSFAINVANSENSSYRTVYRIP